MMKKKSVIKMKFVKQATNIVVNNIDSKAYGGKIKDESNKHSILLPNSIRCLICGPSNCGKTNVLISLLEDPNGLRFENIYLYSLSLYQPKYVYLQHLLSHIKEIGFFMFSSNDEVISPEQAKPNSIFIFDDVITQKQNNIKSYFCMGRHNNIDCFYLSQSYAHIPKHLIRENANFIILFRQDELSLKHLYNDYGLSADMTFDMFKEICKMCWEDRYSFFILDLDKTERDGKYRKGFDNFIKLQDKS